MWWKMVNTVLSADKIGSTPGIYFVKDGEERGLYVVSPRSKTVHKIYNSEDYYDTEHIDELSTKITTLGASKADKTEINNLQKELDELDDEKAGKTTLSDVQNNVTAIAGRVYNVEKNKADKSELQNVISGLRPMGSVETMGELYLIEKPNDGDAYFVNETKDGEGNPYIWRYDKNAGRFINTRQVVYVNLGGKVTVLTERVDDLSDKVSGMILNTGVFNVTEEVPQAEYYTPAFARYVVPAGYRRQGLMLTYAVSEGIWRLERFVSSDISKWNDAAYWKPVSMDLTGEFGDSETVGVSQKGYTARLKGIASGSINFADGTEILDSLRASNMENTDRIGLYLLHENDIVIGHLLSTSTIDQSTQYIFMGNQIHWRKYIDDAWREWEILVPERLNDLTDVQVSNDIKAGDLLVYSGGGWKNLSTVTSTEPIELEDVVIPVTITADNVKTWKFVRLSDYISSTIGGNTVNVSKLYPLAMGQFHTLTTAIAAVEEKKRGVGVVVTFAESLDKWASYQFKGLSTEDGVWKNADMWDAYGAGGGVKKIRFNGEEKEPDGEGIITINTDQIAVDETLDSESTNPVENRVVAGKVTELEASTVFGSDVEVDEESNEATVRLLNKSNTVITEFTVPAGSGGSGETAGSKIVLGAALDKEAVKEGGSAKLTYHYDHVNVGGDDAGSSTGQRAEITITIQKGAQVLYTKTMYGVVAGTYTEDITEHLQQGTIEAYVKAVTNDPGTGKAQSRQAYTSIRVASITLSSSYSIASNISGYKSTDTITIPFTIAGTGTKLIKLYLDGKQYDTRTVTKSGTTNGTFTIPASTLTVGRHTVQMAAEVEISGVVIESESIYIDILRRGEESTIRFIGTKITFADGRIFGVVDHLTPRLGVKRFEQLSFDYVAYDSSVNPVMIDVYHDGSKTQTLIAPRTTQVYANRYTTEGEARMKFVSGSVEYCFYVDVAASDIEIEEVSAGIALRLTAAGRSNGEETPGTWTYGQVTTSFKNFDWQSNGWTGDALKMTNGAKIEIGYMPFENDPTTSGATYEVELECTNISDRNAVVLACMYGGAGFQMTTQEAKMVSKGGVEVSTLYASMNIKAAFVVRNKANHRLIELFVNGIRSGAGQYAADDSFLQAVPSTITVNSDYADVTLRCVRVYNRALSDDECLTNYIVDRATAEEMTTLYHNNDVETDDGSSIDMDRVRAKGKAVMRIVGDVELVNKTNDKKFEVPVDIFYYSPYGKEYDFVARQCGLRIQGTSSTTYPRKNYRIYFDRKSKYGATLEVNGKDVPDMRYSFKPGARPVAIFCMKADFAESSSTHNTGTAALLNDIWKECLSLTPPQAANTGEYDVRTAVDGFPCDMWYDNNGSNVNTYLGKYNFNNEKSASGIVYGFEGIPGINDDEALAGGRNKCLCLEFLNNSEPLCLFTTDDMSRFDDALEFRYKEDTVWATAHADDKTAIQRLWTWVLACKGNGAKFKSEVSQYFDVSNMSLWYLYTDYFMAVDQRAKNMMLATWDGLKWYFLPYDCDTLWGVRNDGLLKYGYTIEHDTYDDSIQSYAFAGHDSVLWDLLRNNMQTELAAAAVLLRTNMTLGKVLDAYNVNQMANWPERVYNKDAEYKYLIPLIDGVTSDDGGNKKYSYLYSLQGSRQSHRTFMIQNRLALLDAKYVAGTSRSDAFTAYFGHKFSADNRSIRIVASDRFYFGYGYTSGVPTVSAVPAGAKGDEVLLTFKTDLIVNDPQNIYGASRIEELDLRDIADTLLQTLNLNGCTALKKLYANCDATNTTLNGILISDCKGLEYLDITGMKSPGFTTLNLTNNSRLRKFFGGKTNLSGVAFALGAPLDEAVIPASAQSLEMRSLNNITIGGLTFENAGNITRLVMSMCEKLDWQLLLSTLYNAHYIRVTGIDMTGDASFLNKYISKGGIDEYGANTNTCRLVGKYQLTSYVEDDQLAIYRAQYPELNILQAEYTSVEFDDAVSDPANISNLDNKTGYKYGNSYTVSGHIKKILSLRHRVLGKKTAEGEVSIYPLHDENSNYYADSAYLDSCTPSVLTGSEGNVWVYEPKYWYKGVNDILNQKKYAFFSSNNTVKQPEGKKIEARDVNIITGYALRATAAFSTLQDALTAVSTMGYGLVSVEGYKRVRFQSTAGALYGAIFLDASDNVVGRVLASSDKGMMNGMYVIANVPTGAVRLGFSIVLADDKDFVWMTNSDNIADMEPDWVEHKEVLGGAYNSIVEDSILRSRSGVTPTTNILLATARTYAQNMGEGFRAFDYELRKDIVNLAFLKYGTRDSVFGFNTAFGVVTGATNICGMNDTKDRVHNGVTLNSDNTLGYDSLLSNRKVWVEGVQFGTYMAVSDLNRATRNLSRASVVSGDNWITKVYFGKYMDVIPTAIEGSSSTHYPDDFVYETRTGVPGIPYGIGYGTTNAMLGLLCSCFRSYAEAERLAARLCFRGTIKKVETLQEYKSLQKLD